MKFCFTKYPVLGRYLLLFEGSQAGRAKKLLAKVSKLRYIPLPAAGVAQLAEQLICNQQVAGSIPIVSSIFRSAIKELQISRPNWSGWPVKVTLPSSGCDKK